ncbi:MAG: tetratricopeptide repeat protein [Balneolaceae bacterium]
MTHRWKRTRLASSILAAGFFFLSACLSTEPTTRHSPDPLSSERALEEIDRKIDSGQDPGPLLLERMEVLKDLADESSPDGRSVYYEEMVQTAATPDLRQSELADQADDRLRSTYEDEFQSGESGLGVAESSSLHHFRNASILQPEESDPYRHLSSILYRQDRIPDAISILESAKRRIDPYPPDMSERIAYLYLESGQLDEAVTRYQSLVDEDSGRIDVRHALVNAFILNEQHSDAVQELRELLETHPENNWYRQSLAVELFFLLQDHWGSTPPTERNENEIRTDLKWVDEAIEQLADPDESPPADTESAYVLAQFYRNSGLYLLEQAEGLPNRIATELVSRGEYLLKEAIPRWKEMADQNPENRELWSHLQVMYLKLGLDEQARQIDEQLNS